MNIVGGVGSGRLVSEWLTPPPHSKRHLTAKVATSTLSASFFVPYFRSLVIVAALQVEAQVSKEPNLKQATQTLTGNMSWAGEQFLSTPGMGLAIVALG